jgi:hypothetical protein
MKNGIFRAAVVVIWLAASRGIAADAKSKPAPMPVRPAPSVKPAPPKPAPVKPAAPKPADGRATAAKPVTAKPNDAAAAAKYELRYRFTVGETIRTKITHASAVSTTIKGVDEQATSHSESVKVWKVTATQPAKATFLYSVEYVAMRGKVGEQAEVTYDSRKDTIVPEMYRGVAKTVGIPLAEIALDSRGIVLLREEKYKGPGASGGGAVTIPLPATPVPIGHVWDEKISFPVVLDGGASQTVNARHRFTLKSVDRGIAKIGVATQVLDPALPPKVEVQILQRIQNGEAHLDLAKGRLVYQKMDVDGSVIDFHGAGSRMKCRIAFTEELLPPSVATAQRK